MNIKHCSRCKQDLPLDAFSRDKSAKDGLSFYCRTCVSERRKLRYVPKPRPEYPDGHRNCTKCGEIKPFSEFHKAKNGRFGLDSVCKPCKSTAKPKPQAKDGHQFCYKCGEEKPFTAEYFRRSSKSKSGLLSLCRVCARQEAKEWREQKLEEDPDYIKSLYWKNPEKQREQKRQDYIKHREKRRKTSKRKYWENVEENRRIAREYARKHREEAKERVRRWRQDNPERYREYNQQWIDENPDTVKKMQQASWVRRRARKRNLPHDLTTEEWQYCLEYWNNACAVCGDGEKLNADHWIPLSNEDCPGTIVDNMIPLCEHCNKTKHARDAELWLTEKWDAEFASEILEAVEAYFEHVVDYFESES
ncbi:MAG: HNH endonuclease [Chloroflexota bacterium]